MKLIGSALDLGSRVQVMGVLNVTPDSFSDGGLHFDPAVAITRAMTMIEEGADLIDIGGESTRPSSDPVSVEEELGRVRPVFEGLQQRVSVPLSVDTTKTEVAAYAVKMGAEIINDVGGLKRNPELASVAADTGAALVLMHSRGTPKTMQQLPMVEDIIAEVTSGLAESIEIALSHGVGEDKLIIDPGIGFGKTAEQNLELINGLEVFRVRFGLPVLLGTSRKSFIGRILGRGRGEAGVSQTDEDRARMFGTAASVACGVLRGARIVRVHDVAEMVTVVRMAEAIAHAHAGQPR
jgi:dihydropteroate synthase